MISLTAQTVRFNAADHGADPTGVGNNDLALKAALNECIAKVGPVELVIPNVGGVNGTSNYRFIDGVGEIDMLKDFTMYAEQGAKISNSATSAKTLMVMRGGTKDYIGPYIHRYYNLDVDLSHGDIGAAGVIQPSFCSPQFVRECYEEGGQYYGGEGWWQGGLTGGDSPWEPIGVTYFESRSAKVRGMLDCAFYCGGANDEFDNDDGFEYKIIDPKIEKCNVAAALKREGRLMTIINPTITECYVGIASLEVGPGQQQSAGQRVKVHGGSITKTQNPVRIHGSECRFKMDATDIEDFGRNPIMVTGAFPAGRSAIWLRGAQKAHINNVAFRINKWPDASNVGIYVSNYTDLAGKKHVGGYNFGEGNFFDGVTVPIYEEADTNPSYFTDGHVYAPLKFDRVRYRSVFAYQQAGNPESFKQIGDINNRGSRQRYPFIPY